MTLAEPAKPVVLLVDDTPANLLALEALLGSRYRFVRATSGKEALALVLHEPIDVILLDVVMPGMDGYEVARNLKLLDRTRGIPILFLTALATEIKQLYRAYDVGAVDYIVKPLDAEVVRRKVAVFVDLVEQRKRIEQQAQALRDADRREYELQIAELRFAGDRRYRKLVEGIDHAIGWTADESFRLTFVSRQAPRILGYPLSDFTAEDFWERRLHPDDRASVMEMFRSAMRDGAELVANHRFVGAEGAIQWFHTGVSGDKPSNGSPRELHGISVDVTDLKRAQEEAQRATHVREELLAVVAHDLRSPLGAIRMSAGLLEHVAQGAGEVRVEAAAQTIIRSAQRMERLINDLLDFALIQAERVTIHPVVLPAFELVQDSMEAVQHVANEKQQRITFHVDEGLHVECDRDRVVQVLNNLIGNAVKFTPPRGSIEVRAVVHGDRVRFSVQDTGPGIPPEYLDRMWDRFWQAKRRTEGGIGLGLSIAKGLVEAHGGRIWAESTVGQGTTIHFTIAASGPIRESAARAGVEEPDGRGATGPG